MIAKLDQKDLKRNKDTAYGLKVHWTDGKHMGSENNWNQRFICKTMGQEVGRVQKWEVDLGGVKEEASGINITKIHCAYV